VLGSIGAVINPGKLVKRRSRRGAWPSLPAPVGRLRSRSRCFPLACLHARESKARYTDGVQYTTLQCAAAPSRLASRGKVLTKWWKCVNKPTGNSFIRQQVWLNTPGAYRHVKLRRTSSITQRMARCWLAGPKLLVQAEISRHLFRWIILLFCPDIRGSQRADLTDFGDLFSSSAIARSTFCRNYLMGCDGICSRHSRFPRDES